MTIDRPAEPVRSRPRACTGPGQPARRVHLLRALLAGAGVAGVLALSACTGAANANSSPLGAVGGSTGGAAAESSVQSTASSAQPTSDNEAGYAGGAAASASGMALPEPTSTPISTSGPAPVQGDISQEVPAQTLTTAAAQPVDQPGDFGSGVTAAVVSMAAVDGVAQGAGEIAAPAVAVTVEIRNGSADPVGLDSVEVDLRTADGVSAGQLSGDPAKPLSGALAPGESRSGVYVFTVPTDQRANLSLLLSYSAQAPVLQFTGSV